MPVEITPQYMEAARRFMDNHPSAEAALHRAHLGGLGLSEEAQAEIVKRNAPELAHHPQIGQIGAQPKSEHAKAVAALHEKERSGDDHENSETDKYLSERKQHAKSNR
jgi:hypothetical protein